MKRNESSWQAKRLCWESVYPTCTVYTCTTCPVLQEISKTQGFVAHVIYSLCGFLSIQVYAHMTIRFRCLNTCRYSNTLNVCRALSSSCLRCPTKRCPKRRIFTLTASREISVDKERRLFEVTINQKHQPIKTLINQKPTWIYFDWYIGISHNTTVRYRRTSKRDQ